MEGAASKASAASTMEGRDAATSTTTGASSSSTSTRKQTVAAAANATTTTAVKVDPTLCRNYALRGSCRFGNRCNFLHILPNDCDDWHQACRRIPCPHFKIGLCRYGTMCRLAHVGEEDDNTVDETKQNVPNRPEGHSRTDAQLQEPAAIAATGQGASTAANPHEKKDDDTMISSKLLEAEGVDSNHKDDDDDDDQKPPARPSCKNKEQTAVGVVVVQTDEENHDDDDDDDDDEMVCGICLDPLGRSIPIEEDHTEGKNKNGRAMTMTATSQRKKFGLLTGCNHIFCIDCLRHWRKEQKKEASENNGYGEIPEPTGSDRVRSCPTCRQVSDFVVPSDRFCIGAEKDQVVASYQARLSCISCQRFNGRLGSCPFGRDCFYAHRHPQTGHDMKVHDRSKQQLWEEKQRRKNQQQEQQLQRIHIDGLGTFTRLPDFNGVPQLRFDYPALLAGIEDDPLLEGDEDEGGYSPSRYSAGSYARATNRGSRGPGDRRNNADGDVRPPSFTHMDMTGRRSSTGNRNNQANYNWNRNSNSGGGPSMRSNYYRGRDSGIRYEGGNGPLPAEFEAQLLHAFRRHIQNVAASRRQQWRVEDPDV